MDLTGDGYGLIYVTMAVVMALACGSGLGMVVCGSGCLWGRLFVGVVVCGSGHLWEWLFVGSD